ncbi:flavorubredoxin [Halanaerobium saccharolyticum]|uniref:Flavorubredoxin n=1 Tax=Halanaerobium saccharolyticum TaxID=43595 RepID=A0A4R7YY89_9FIRM|nr:FprA family A-type flavoprotein [Halanaerobium saccharolyticum]RAK07381.1 flavorubredoxin [Halanaerobium saccharolyticum]TDW02346.1 flavorubredoxin [Halanaerobium saccharolyticum]TDX59066.1 flavorubredoxin [Halanaerobium saccharolyticum]
MYNSIKLSENVHWVGVNDKETDLFESLWPLPEGISYNSYVINDDKVALIDTVKINYTDTYLEKVKDVIGDKKVDYLIINHMEPDHSGSIKSMRETFPEMKIVGNAKTMNFLEGFYGITEGTMVIEDGDELDLGSRTLKFYLTPMVHWPETMMTFDQKDKILFSGDAFGGFGSLNGYLFDDEVNIKHFEEEIRRYFSNIIGKYGPVVHRSISRLRQEIDEIGMVASTHGLVWRNDPAHIIDEYDKWSQQQTEKGVVVVYGSMYGNTKVMAEAVARSLSENGIEQIKLFDVSRKDVSFIINDIWKYNGIVLGSCTYNTKIFPPMEYLLKSLESRNLKARVLGIFGSYSWSGGALDRLEDFKEKVNCDLVEPVIESQFAPGGDILEKCYLLGKNVAEQVKENN